jgi:disabled family protein 2
MSDTSVSSPESPTTSNKSNAKKFEGDGVSFKGKLIGVDELSIDRDEKICLDSMFKLKAVVRARGEHKQKIQLNLTMSSVKIIDDTTKVFITVDFFFLIENSLIRHP